MYLSLVFTLTAIVFCIFKLFKIRFDSIVSFILEDNLRCAFP